MFNRKCATALLTALLVASTTACGGAQTPEALCNHVLTKFEKLEGEKLANETKECVEELTEMKKQVGEEKFAKFAGCVIGAADEEAARKCEPG